MVDVSRGRREQSIHSTVVFVVLDIPLRVLFRVPASTVDTGGKPTCQADDTIPHRRRLLPVEPTNCCNSPSAGNASQNATVRSFPVANGNKAVDVDERHSIRNGDKIVGVELKPEVGKSICVSVNQPETVLATNLKPRDVIGQLKAEIKNGLNALPVGLTSLLLDHNENLSTSTSTPLLSTEQNNNKNNNSSRSTEQVNYDKFTVDKSLHKSKYKQHNNMYLTQQGTSQTSSATSLVADVDGSVPFGNCADTVPTMCAESSKREMTSSDCDEDSVFVAPKFWTMTDPEAVLKTILASTHESEQTKPQKQCRGSPHVTSLAPEVVINYDLIEKPVTRHYVTASSEVVAYRHSDNDDAISSSLDLSDEEDVTDDDDEFTSSGSSSSGSREELTSDTWTSEISRRNSFRSASLTSSGLGSNHCVTRQEDFRMYVDGGRSEVSLLSVSETDQNDNKPTWTTVATDDIGVGCRGPVTSAEHRIITTPVLMRRARRLDVTSSTQRLHQQQARRQQLDVDQRSLIQLRGGKHQEPSGFNGVRQLVERLGISRDGVKSSAISPTTRKRQNAMNPDEPASHSTDPPEITSRRVDRWKRLLERQCNRQLESQSPLDQTLLNVASQLVELSATDDKLADQLLSLNQRIQQHKLVRHSRLHCEVIDAALESEEKREELTNIQPFIDVLPETFNQQLKHCGLTRSHLRTDQQRRFTVF